MAALLGMLAGEGGKALIEGVGKIAGDLITTDKERMQFQLEDKKLDQAGDLAQIEVNKAEAESHQLFIGGWRSAVGWAGAMGVWCAFVPKALVMTVFWAYTAWVVISRWSGAGEPPALPVFPDLGITDLMGLLASLLGMGYMRHRETLAGVARTGLPAAGGASTSTPSAGQQEAP